MRVDDADEIESSSDGDVRGWAGRDALRCIKDAAFKYLARFLRFCLAEVKQKEEIR